MRLPAGPLNHIPCPRHETAAMIPAVQLDHGDEKWQKLPCRTLNSTPRLCHWTVPKLMLDSDDHWYGDGASDMFEDQSWQWNIRLGNLCRVVLWCNSTPCWLGMRCWSLPSRLIHAWRAGTLCCVGSASPFHTRCTRLPCRVGRLCWVDSLWGPAISAGSAACAGSAISAGPSARGVTSLARSLWRAGRLCWVSSLCRVGNLCPAVRPWHYVCICRLLRHLHRTFLVHSCPPSLKWHCWQCSRLLPRLRKWDHIGNFGTASSKDECWSRDSAILWLRSTAVPNSE